MSKVVSFSLWGNLPMYCIGAIRNAELMPKIYPGWSMVLYRGPGVPDDIIQQLIALKVDVRPGVFANGMFDRYLAYDDNIEVCLFRDCDSRISVRERSAVDAWLSSNYLFHSLCDHPNHTNPFMGGLTGAKRGGIKSFRKLIEAYPASHVAGAREQIYGNDQKFLRDIVWSMVKHTTLRHDLVYLDKFPNTVHFPSTYGDDAFCGEVMDENDKPRIFNRWQRIPYQSA